MTNLQRSSDRPDASGRQVTLSLGRAFEELRHALELTPLQESTVAERQSRIRKVVSESLSVTGDFLTGSYARHTLIAPLAQADVDVVLILDPRYRSTGPRGVLDSVRDVLKASYPHTTAISRNGQEVTVRFSDFVVDVVPAFSRSGWDRFWGSNAPFQICNSITSEWINTDPGKHIEIGANANKLHDGGLVPRIKQLKGWNRAAGEPLRSFHLEVLAWRIFGISWPGHKQPSDWIAVRYFLDRLRGELPNRQQDPAGSDGDVGAYLTGRRLEEAVHSAEVAYNRCVMAEMASEHGDLKAMHYLYSLVFGEYYPTTS
jgi:hypothetical protein